MARGVAVERLLIRTSFAYSGLYDICCCTRLVSSQTSEGCVRIGRVFRVRKVLHVGKCVRSVGGVHFACTCGEMGAQVRGLY